MSAPTVLRSRPAGAEALHHLRGQYFTCPSVLVVTRFRTTHCLAATCSRHTKTHIAATTEWNSEALSSVMMSGRVSTAPPRRPPWPHNPGITKCIYSQAIAEN